jgi:hypothetical protein
MPRTAAGTAAAWPQLPQLISLSIHFSKPPSEEQLAAVLTGVAAATSLEFLTMTNLAVLDDDEDAAAAVGAADDEDPVAIRAPAAVCSSLIGLTRLQLLSLHDSLLLDDDAMALTALTNQTRLDLSNTGFAVSDVAATALACSLRQLASLNLSDCELKDMVCLAAIGSCTS